MTAAVAALNIALGLVYVQYGTLTLVEMLRNRRRMGFSHFGTAWVLMAFTCGPHHVHHGAHLLLGHGRGQWADLFVVLVGVPAGVTWFALRVEAFTGGRGDRFVSGTPWWVTALPMIGAAYLAMLVTLAVQAAARLDGGLLAVGLPNLLLVGLYAAVGVVLVRTQMANRRPLGGWSASGLALAVIFPTCAVMHGVHAFYAATGDYPQMLHGQAVDWLAVPAAAYFLWVVHGLYTGALLDWNRVRATVGRRGSARPAAPVRAASGSA